MSIYKESYESHKEMFFNIANEYSKDRTSKTFYIRVLQKGKNENSDESSEKDWKDIQNKFIQVYDKYKLYFEFDTSELKVNDHRMLTEEGCWKDGKYPKNPTDVYLFKSSVYGIFEALFKWINHFEDRFFINHQHHSLESNATSIFSRLCEYINRDYESIKKFIYSDFFYDKNANEIMKYNFEHGGKYVKGILQLLQIIDNFLYISDDQIDEELKNKISKIEKRFFEEHNLYHRTAVSMASRKNILERGRLHIGNSTSIKDIELIQKKFKEVNDIWKTRCCDKFVGPKTEEKYSWKNHITPSSQIINKLRFNFYVILDQLFSWMIIPESDFMLNDYSFFDKNTFTNMGIIEKYILNYNNPKIVEDNCYQNIEKRIQENKKLELDIEHLAIIKYNINNGSCCRDNILKAFDRISKTLVEYVEKPNLEKYAEEARIEKREENKEEVYHKYQMLGIPIYKEAKPSVEDTDNPLRYMDPGIREIEEENLKYELKLRTFDDLTEDEKRRLLEYDTINASEQSHNPIEIQDSVLNFNDEQSLKLLDERFFDKGYKLILGGSHIIFNSQQLKTLGGFIIGNPIVVYPPKEKGDIKMQQFPLWMFSSFIDKK